MVKVQFRFLFRVIIWVRIRVRVGVKFWLKAVHMIREG